MTQLELKTEEAGSSLGRSKATRDLFSKDKVEFFKKIGPDIAHQMAKCLQELTGENIKVEFDTVQTFEEDKVLIDTGEKCFGSSMNFTCPEAELDGIAVMFFPLSSTRILTESLLKRYLGQSDKEEIGPEIKLSAFKETLSILLSTYTTGIANALEIKIETSMPKLVRFRNVEFEKSPFLDGPSNSQSMISVGQFNISAAAQKTYRERDEKQRPRRIGERFLSSAKGPGKGAVHLLKGALLLLLENTN